MSKKLLTGALALLVLPATALAHNYTYLEGGFLERDNDDVDDSGIRIMGSGAVAPQIALIGEYADTDDYEQFSAGGIFHAPLGPALDWYGGATLEYVDAGFDDDTGLGLRGGLRWGFAGSFEMNPELRYVDVFDRSDTSLRLAGLLRVTPQLDIQAALQGGDDDRLEAGIRYNFTP